MTLSVNGLINGERAQDSLNGLLTIDGPRSRVRVAGNLLGEIAAQIGGAVVGLFTPQSVDFYKMPDGLYVAINGFLPICVRPQSEKVRAIVEDISPAGLLSMLTSPEVARGTYAGEGTLNGRAVKHYIIDGAAFLAAAQASSDPKLRAFGAGLWWAGDNDLYVDKQGGYPVAFRGDYRGAYAPLKFQGDFEFEIHLTSVGEEKPVRLPAPCADPITM